MAHTKQMTEAQIRAEMDANTLIEAEELKADKGRMSKAQAALKNLVREAEKKAAAVKKVIAKKPTAKPKARKKK